MSPRHQAGRHPALPLSHATVAQEVVAVHQGQLVQEQLHGALAPPFLRTFALPVKEDESEGKRRRGRGASASPAPVSV